MHILYLCVTVTDVFVDVIRFLHGGDLGDGGGVGKARSQSRSPTRAKVISKVTQGHVKVTFKVKYINHSEGHSNSFQGQT